MHQIWIVDFGSQYTQLIPEKPVSLAIAAKSSLWMKLLKDSKDKSGRGPWFVRRATVSF